MISSEEIFFILIKVGFGMGYFRNFENTEIPGIEIGILKYRKSPKNPGDRDRDSKSSKNPE